MYDGGDVMSASNIDPVGDRLEWTANTTHSFPVKIATPSIVIQLLEDEPRSRQGVADISGYRGGGVDVLRKKVPRGAEFHATYDLRTNKLDGDRTELENGYLRTSGEYDGSISDNEDGDENDADLWFRVSDNYEPPTAKATANTGNIGPIHVGDRVDFDGGASRASDGSSITKYQWDFESDGRVEAEGERASHAYPREGDFTATLRVTDSLGESSTCSVEVAVTSDRSPPNPSFTFFPSTPTVNDIINFTDTSTAVDGSIQAWQWDFGDGSSSTLRNPSHQFSVADNYTISLTLTDDSGSIGTLSKRISVKPSPDATPKPQPEPQDSSSPQPEQPTVEDPQNPTYSPEVESSRDGTERLQVAGGIVLAGLLAAASFLLVVRRS
jgi:PKD repeat protein